MNTQYPAPTEIVPVPRERGQLPTRLIDIIAMMADGLTAKEIAKHLNIPPNTVNSYIAVAMAHAGVHRSTALVAKALREGWID